MLTRAAWVAIVTFGIAVASAAVFRVVASPPASTILWKLSWLPACLVGLYAAHRFRPRESLRELGFSRGPLRGLAFGLASTLPMALVFVAFLPFNSHPAIGAFLSTAVLAPVTEETLFRGYLFRQLYSRAGWSFPAAVGMTAVLFGLAHIPALVGRVSAWGVLGEIAVIASGGAFFSWLFVKWTQDLWVPIAIHGFMNLWCETFSCDEVVGSQTTLVGRVVTIILAAGLTALYGRRKAVVA